MTSLTRTSSNQAGSTKPEQNMRGWPLVLVLVSILAAAGWAYLIAMVADMVPVMDMSEAGPGMVILNSFNQFAGLPAEARAALAVLCLPTSATFGMPGAGMTTVDLVKIFLMWAMMALAMMLPTAVPMLRAYYTEISAQSGGTATPVLLVITAMFGYLAVWLGYAVAATAAQWALSRAGAMTNMMAPASMALTTSVLFAAGLYQFTPPRRPVSGAAGIRAGCLPVTMLAGCDVWLAGRAGAGLGVPWLLLGGNDCHVRGRPDEHRLDRATRRVDGH